MPGMRLNILGHAWGREGREDRRCMCMACQADKARRWLALTRRGAASSQPVGISRAWMCLYGKTHAPAQPDGPEMCMLLMSHGSEGAGARLCTQRRQNAGAMKQMPCMPIL